MTKEKTKSTGSAKPRCFNIEGHVHREQPECESGELNLVAYVFDKAGALLGNACIDSKGNYNVSVNLARPSDVNLLIGPEGDAQQIRHSSAFSTTLLAQNWQEKGSQFSQQFDALIPLEIWRPWWPQRICISGHIRKVVQQDESVEFCPVPFVKVEIFDVDREPCLWPLLRLRPERLFDKPVVRIPDLLNDSSAIPEPLPDPIGPFPSLPFAPGPLPGPDPIANINLEGAGVFRGNGTSSSLKSTLPSQLLPAAAATSEAFMRVGESRQLPSSIASRLDKLTLTSRLAPWLVFRNCFYSKALICETTTDCNGYFNCCFNWWPFHFRRGRLRYDSRPDIIIKVTQLINGVETVIYMDPYTSTRWNVNNAHLDLFLDNEEVVCGNGNCYQPPQGSPVFFTRIGDDEVYQIDQTTGLFNGLISGVTHNNVAYGSTMFVYGQFGDDLTRSDPAAGGPQPYFYYRLSYARQGSADDEYKFIDRDLSDTRVDKATLNAQSHKLGPFTVNGAGSLYEMRNFEEYYWYNPDWIGIWNSIIAEEDTATYVLRMEVFDQSGNRIDTAAGTVDYRNGAGVGNGSAPMPLPAMTDHSDLLITLDNKRPVAELEVAGVINDCGVIPWSAVPPLNFFVNASQENNRLRGWHLWYTKGVGSEVWLEGAISTNGLPGSYNNHLVNGDSLITGLTTTCAFALRLRAWAHVRNGRHFIYIDQDIDAIAIEKCPECPPA